jgi:large subunit ribosomal protein L4
MATIDIKDPSGATKGSVELDSAMFGIEPNVAVMHQVVTAQLAARRSGTQSTKTRAEVSGGGAKPWRQKGTGRARQGSNRSPQWRGGGVALGPKPRSYAQRTPKKMIKLALRSALSDRAADGKIVVVDAWQFDTPSTKGAVKALDALGLDGRVLIVLGPGEHDTWKSFRNLQGPHPILAAELNAYDVLCSDWVVFTKDTLPSTAETTDTPPAKPAKATKAAKAPAAAKAAAAAKADKATETPVDIAPPADAAGETDVDADTDTDAEEDKS